MNWASMYLFLEKWMPISVLVIAALIAVNWFLGYLVTSIAGARKYGCKDCPDWPEYSFYEFSMWGLLAWPVIVAVVGVVSGLVWLHNKAEKTKERRIENERVSRANNRAVPRGRVYPGHTDVEGDARKDGATAER